MSLKNLMKIYEPWLNNGITSTNIPLKAEYDIVWLYKFQIEIVMPTFTFYDLQKQPYKHSEMKNPLYSRFNSVTLPVTARLCSQKDKNVHVQIEVQNGLLSRSPQRLDPKNLCQHARHLLKLH